MADPQGDSFRAARESDFRRIVREVAGLAYAQRTLAAKVAALEAAAADLRADVIAGREIDEELGEAFDELLADLTAGRR